MNSDIRKARTIANYQFGSGAGHALFPDDATIRLSTSGRIRQILRNEERIATLRADDNQFTLGKIGALRLHAFLPHPEMRVTVNSDSAPFVLQGKTAFARHVVGVDPRIRSGDEVLVVDCEDNLLATGEACLSASELLSFDRGMGVDVRVGLYAASSSSSLGATPSDLISSSSSLNA
uniref:tRNA-guanine(15) transglycosylase n=1 Tax=Candidatus Methanogaster sp. ANME-2c ERB4 TaxID=2759911 RepID=A0A7G9Y016_9EURY|nr:tRNA-guanine(15) transglycosylase [Methanosarcinales archaeon ANME-2c ERB4]QNO42344.1 tRNA-guanine(15) transglycosylase [Methanosarcinales archaeon ANME-2c ERB4]QNO43087.1 tRNA-guanine(15) transglycosylase [Methanosarcinales archaeon ANME-2c ERB4]QNO43118.1 tRNA-guanine(15) transglycosylase [Methanosarcinales archaeon ANME-2c ERB4]QNO45240.1 tRNA-guanine(15) transglycosylase [Methanosarcinales archaeon ANME-2c ERB4]